MFKWLRGEKQGSPPPEVYPQATREAVRRWINRFIKDGDPLPQFWYRVQLHHAQYGTPPEVNTVIRSILEDRRAEHFRRGQMGLVRNDTYSLSLLLEQEGRHRERLPLAIEVTTLDAAGASNVSWDEKFGGFNADLAFVAPVCPAMLADCAVELELTIDELRDCVINEADEYLSSLDWRRPAITGQDVWEQVADAVKISLTAPVKKRRGTRLQQPVLPPIE